MKKKSTLIIPAAGKSSRYPNVRPKWLLTHPSGRLMIDLVLDSMNYKDYGTTVITILREHCENHHADVVLKQIFGDSIKLLVLDDQTESPAETIYKTIKELKIDNQIVIKDSDALVKVPYSPEKNYTVGLKINDKTSVEKIQEKSFIIKNDDNLLKDILEKQIVSDIICLGIFSMSSSEFVSAYENICTNDVYKCKNEIYVSHIISYLVTSQQTVFEYVEATDYVDWGTIEEWYKEINKHKTYIFDIDGVLLENCGKYGKNNWSNYFKPIENNIDVLKELSDNGNEIIFMTSRSEEYLDQFKDLMKKLNIKYKTIITSCNHSKRVIINDFSSTNPYPSCESLSIKRNDRLTNYLRP